MMSKIKIFISSVCEELSEERIELHRYIHSDALLGKFFEAFLFELMPACDLSASRVYLREVEQCTIYIGLLGVGYGSEDADGVSPTEREFDHATLLHKTRFVYISHHATEERHPKEIALIQKAESVLVRKSFRGIDELKTSIYSSLINYLMEKEIIRTAPFDASSNEKATIADIDAAKIKAFVQLAKSKRGFPLPETTSVEDVLIHLNLLSAGKLSNAAVLLFGSAPQRFFINSEVRCAYFLGKVVEKPITSYKVFKGDVFELVDQAEEFVLSKLDYAIGTRNESTSINGAYEIPKGIIAEAIVNAIAHRDYTSNGSVQVMLFKDRLEIWNPGNLPLGLSPEKLKLPHRSMPPNPLLAEPMYLAGYIEGIGSGTLDMISLAQNAGLNEPQFVEDFEFKVVVFRKVIEESELQDVDMVSTPYDTPYVTPYVTPYDTPYDELEITPEVERLIKVLKTEMGRLELQNKLGLTNSKYFRENYLQKAINLGVIEMTIPDKPKSKNQKYRATNLTKKIKTKFKSRK